MLDLYKFLTVQNIHQNLTCVSKEECINILVNSLGSSGKIPEEFLTTIGDEVLEREKKGSTGIGNGIAIPHCKTQHIDGIVAALGVHSEGLDFQSLDKKPVNIILLTISSTKMTGPYLQFLSQICSLLKNETYCEAIIKANKPEEILERFQNV